MTFTHETGKILKTGCADIYYEETGNPAAEVLLFLHGGLGNIEDLNVMLPLLKKEYRIIGIDTRGHGKSTLGDEGLSYQRIQEDAEIVLKELGISKLSIIGFSDGGIAAYRLGSMSNLQIKRLVTIGSRWHSSAVVESRDVLSGITAEIWKTRFPETVNAYEKLNPEPDFERLVNSTVKMWLDTTSSGYPDEDVKNISCSILVMRGDKDRVVSAKAAFGISEAAKMVEKANIPFAGHPAYIEQTNIVMEIINQFLDRPVSP